jgi:uncharacterized protein involved in exopolysaccharide biosynthesis
MFKRFWWVFLAMIPVGSIAGLLVAAVVTYVMPKMYESEATIEVKPLGGESASQMTPQFFGTEFEKIKSSNSLGKVVENLALIDKWGVDKETALRILKGIVTTQNIRGTDLISIRVRHTNKEDARDITAEVAKAYREYRMEISKRGDGERLLELKKAVFDQEDKVEERRRILATIMKLRNNTDDVGTGEITNDGANSNEESPEPDKAEDSAKRREVDAPTISDAKRDLETDQALLQSLKLKQINDDIAAKLQDESIVIHEEPQLGQAPVSPNVPLNLMLGTALGLLLSPLLSLPVILLLSRLRPAKVSA